MVNSYKVQYFLPLLAGLGLLFSFVSPVWAQVVEDPCDELVQTVSRLYKSPARLESDMLVSIARVAQQGRLCYGSERVARVIWLLNNEVWALDLLERREEAEALVDLFYDQYEAEATDEYRARFAIHRMHLKVLKGDLVGAALAHYEAERYRDALPLAVQVDHLLNGSYLYRETGNLDQALRFARQADVLAAGDSTLYKVWARALRFKSEIALTLEQKKPIPDPVVLELVINDLKQAHTLYHTPDPEGNDLTPLIILSRVYATLGDFEHAHRYLASALEKATARGDTRQRIATRLSRGNIFIDQRYFRRAEADFREAMALADSSGLHEFDLDLMLGMAHLYEAEDQWAQAEQTYRLVLASEAPEGSLVEAVRAKQEAQAALVRLVMQGDQRHVSSVWRWVSLVLLIVLGGPLIALGYLFYRRRSTQAQPIDGASVPDPHSLLALDDEAALVRQRLAAIHRVLTAPQTLALDDPVLAEALREGLRTSKQLFECVAALEERETGVVFENDPSNTIGRYLRQEFRARHIPWPQTPEAWWRLLSANGGVR